jgi:hypothetical protein
MTLLRESNIVTFLSCQKPFTAELAEYAEAYLCLLCVLSALGGEKPSPWELQWLEKQQS